MNCWRCGDISKRPQSLCGSQVVRWESLDRLLQDIPSASQYILLPPFWNSMYPLVPVFTTKGLFELTSVHPVMRIISVGIIFLDQVLVSAYVLLTCAT